MVLKTKSILVPKSVDDGLRVSIMSRHTLNDGKTPDERISVDVFDDWWKALAPPSKLIGQYYREKMPWEEFAKQFNVYLQLPEVHEILLRLIELVRTQDVTLMCIEDAPEYCHRRLVVERCSELDLSLEVIIE